jgi:hypothetical protein
MSVSQNLQLVLCSREQPAPKKRKAIHRPQILQFRRSYPRNKSRNQRSSTRSVEPGFISEPTKYRLALDTTTRCLSSSREESKAGAAKSGSEASHPVQYAGAYTDLARTIRTSDLPAADPRGSRSVARDRAAQIRERPSRALWPVAGFDLHHWLPVGEGGGEPGCARSTARRREEDRNAGGRGGGEEWERGMACGGLVGAILCAARWGRLVPCCFQIFFSWRSREGGKGPTFYRFHYLPKSTLPMSFSIIVIMHLCM